MPGADMPTKTTQTNTADDTKRRKFMPIRMDLLERLTRECDSIAHTAPSGQGSGTPQHASRLLRQR